MAIESEQKARRRKAFHRYGNETPSKTCPTCGDMFFTQVGLDEHVRLGTHRPRVTIRWITGKLPPAVFASRQETGRRVAALNNARRRRCDACGHVTTPAALGSHQRFTGHIGWTEIPS
jgi:uncharacterized OB-fold protein